MMGMMTVREHIQFNADLRLRGTTAQQRKERVRVSDHMRRH